MEAHHENGEHGGPELGDRGAPATARTPIEAARTPIERAQAVLEHFSLTPSEAKTLVAVMRLGTCTVPQLAPLTGIGRTNLYRVLESLAHQTLIDKVPESSPAIWVAREREEIIELIRERERERLRKAEAGLDDVRAAIEAVPEPKETAAAAFRLIDEPTFGIRYGEVVGSVADRLLVFNRGPYVGEIGVDPAVAATVGRGVDVRAVWQTHELFGPGSEQVLRCAADYARAGVATRVTDELPLSLAILDDLTFLRVPAEPPSDIAYVATVEVDNRAYTTGMAGMFEHFWNQASPFDPSLDPSVSATPEPA